MKTRYLALAGILVALPLAAIAHEHGEGRGRGKAMLDADGNITVETVRAASAERMKRLDKNGDGVLTPDEAPRLFDRPDADGDGKITAEEMAAQAEARLKRADADGDGKVTEAERQAIREKMGRGHGRHHGGETPPDGSPQ